MDGQFFDLDWGKEGSEMARNVHRTLRNKDENFKASVSMILFASAVTARGRRRSPSSVLETLTKSKRRTNPWIVDHLRDAWNVASEQSEETSERFDVLLKLIGPRHRNSQSGISDTLQYQLVTTYESFVDWWITLADFCTGFRSVTTKVFGIKETTGINDYLCNGMTRSQLLYAFGHEIRDITNDEGEASA